MIYADNASTTRLSENVLNTIINAEMTLFANPSSQHDLGLEVRDRLEKCRKNINSLFKTRHGRMFFTSSGTESNNWAIKGVAKNAMKRDKYHIITTNIEHPSVMASCRHMEGLGFVITHLPVDNWGRVSPQQVAAAIQNDTALVSIMFVNNEIGTIQPIKEIGEICRIRGIPFHTDAVQAVGNVPINIDELNVDLLTISGHKIHAPKGIGLLFVRDGIEIDSLIDGGHQEHGKRAGTESVASILALSQAISDAVARPYTKKLEQVYYLRNILARKIASSISGVTFNTVITDAVAGILNLSFEGINGKNLQMLLSKDKIYVSTGAACASRSAQPSHVLKAIGRSLDTINGTIRISIDEDITEEDIATMHLKIKDAVKSLRDMSNKLGAE